MFWLLLAIIGFILLYLYYRNIVISDGVYSFSFFLALVNSVLFMLIFLISIICQIDLHSEVEAIKLFESQTKKIEKFNDVDNYLVSLEQIKYIKEITKRKAKAKKSIAYYTIANEKIVCWLFLDGAFVLDSIHDISID